MSGEFVMECDTQVSGALLLSTLPKAAARLGQAPGALTARGHLLADAGHRAGKRLGVAPTEYVRPALRGR